MPKSFRSFVWTLVIAIAAFAAGRWTADESILTARIAGVSTDSTDADSTQRLAANANLGGSSNKLDISTAPAFDVRHKPAVNNQSKQSYATDYQRMQQLLALAASNPQLAMEQAQQFKGAIRTKAQAAILEVWAGLDPNAAWAWVDSFQPDNKAQFIHLLEVIGRSEPRTAMTFAEKFVVEHRELRKDIYLATVTGITQSGAYTLARDLVERLEIEAETKAELMNFVVGSWATYEPQAAMQWVMAQPEEFKAAAVESMGESWSDADPQATLNFAVGLSSGAARETLLQSSFKKWLATDPAAADTWLASAPSHQYFDPLISELATQPSVNNGQVKAALSWAGKLHSSELRLNTVTTILSAFKQKDPSAAAAYLQEITYLSDAERAQLRENLAFDN